MVALTREQRRRRKS